MIIITMNNGIKLKYKGAIKLYIDEEYPHVLMVTSDFSTNIGFYNWVSETWDNIFFEDIKSIEGVN